VFAVDASTWCRNDADCSAERGYYYHSSRHSGGQPIVAGWSYQWIAQLNCAGADKSSGQVGAVIAVSAGQRSGVRGRRGARA
jgi:hypothetical protein